ncbi:ABC transporter permease [Actinacidiphila epipremni]|uniref:ABC transporter permease n=1 Tax=Actinacidiphila epipremni TaxID=2053013 RepID=A0ABX0ZNT6_9ACTN|nr:ABC transporter permease [Actinacidiphila epipremni]NJP44351.1 ABC transporter permease [Actinacidiphila epipremni]
MNIAFVRLEFKRLVTNRRFWIFSLSLPVVLYLLEISAYGKGDVPGTHISYAAYLMCSFAAWGSIHATLIVGSRIAIERSSGWQRQLRLTPLRPQAYLAAKVTVGMMITLPAPILMSIVGRFNDVHLSSGDWAKLVLGTWVATLPFAVLGTLLGQMAKAETVSGYFGAALLLLGFLGGVLMPTTSFPDWLQHVSKVMPSYWLADIGRAAVTGISDLGTAIGMLAAWTVVLGVAVVFRYQRDSAR